MAQLNITLDTELLHEFFTKDNRDDEFSKLLEGILIKVLLAQSTEQLGADPYEHSEGRTAYYSEFRDREITTSTVTLTLHVPRHREWNFSTTMFEKYQRSEQALVLSMISSHIDSSSS